MPITVRVNAGNTITTEVKEDYVLATIEGTIVEEPDPDPEPEPEPEPPPEPDPDDLIDVRDHGARNGQDSTDAWQRACDEAAGTDKIVVGHPEDTYILNQRGTVTMGVYWSRYCVGLRSNTRIDGRGCTFKLADNAAALCFSNLDQNGGFRGLDFRNIQHDGNRSKQPNWSDREQEIGLIGLYAFEDVTLEHLNTWDVKGHVGRLLNGRRLRMLDCHCKGCDCDVWSIGLDRYPVHDCHIEKVGGEDIRHRAFRNHQGNPVITSANNSTFLDIYGSHAGGGHKYQGVSNGLTVGHSQWRGGTHGTANCGSKFQGNQSSQSHANRVRNVTADFVESDDCVGEGMRFSDCEDIHVKKYIGHNNAGPVGTHPCVRICHFAYRIRVDELESYGSKGHGVHAHNSSQYSTDIRDLSIGSARVQGCAGDAVAIHANCQMTIDQLDCVNVAGRHVSASSGARVHIRLLRANKPQSTHGSGITIDRYEAI